MFSRPNNKIHVIHVYVIIAFGQPVDGEYLEMLWKLPLLSFNIDEQKMLDLL